MAKSHPTDEPEHPDRPGHPSHPDHDLPHRPGHPDHDLPHPPEKPEKPQPEVKAHRITRTVDAPATSVSRLLPQSVAIGDPSFVVRVIGTGFDATSVIVFAGEDEETTFVSDVELTTLVDMTVWAGTDPAIPVLVRTTFETGPEESNSVDFAFTPAREVPLEEAHASIPVPTMDLITRM